MTLPMTKVPGSPDSSTACPGMAYFAGTGPSGKTCGDCQYRGMWRAGERRNRNTGLYEDTRYRYGGCVVFHQLAGKHGPPVRADYNACKYFAQKDRS